MATYNQYHPTHIEKKGTLSSHLSKLNLWAAPIGRTFYSLIFILSGINHFRGSTIAYAESIGIPMANVLTPISGLMILIGGGMILTGFRVRIGAALLAVFLVLTMFMVHDFWNVADPMSAQNQMTHFMKNLSMLGGSILIMLYGTGPKNVVYNHKE